MVAKKTRKWSMLSLSAEAELMVTENTRKCHSAAGIDSMHHFLVFLSPQGLPVPVVMTCTIF